MSEPTLFEPFRHQIGDDVFGLIASIKELNRPVEATPEQAGAYEQEFAFEVYRTAVFLGVLLLASLNDTLPDDLLEGYIEDVRKNYKGLRDFRNGVAPEGGDDQPQS
jgi:hypothetical protein